MTGAVRSAARAPLWRGRVLAVLGIVLCAFSLRSAVASLSPVVDRIGAEYPLSAAMLGIVGTLPPVCFAVFGLLTPVLEKRFGLERVAAFALSAVALGLVARGLSFDAISLLITSGVIFAGVGMGNILLPPLVKKYFPDRLGAMMTLYTTMMAVSTFLPPLVAVPVADGAGWRFSLAMWGVFALAGIFPWVILLVRERIGQGIGASAEPAAPAEAAPPEEPALLRPRADYGDAASMSTGPIVVAPPDGRILTRMLRIPLAWAIAIVFSTSSTLSYVAFAWLPQLLVDRVGVDEATAGTLLSLFALIGLPAGLVVPLLVVRFQATRSIYIVGMLGALAGVAGMLFAPVPALIPLWVVLYGCVGLMFPLALVLISIRARTPESAVALSGFAQSTGYMIAAVFPVLVGVLHDATGGWDVPLIVLGGVVLASIPAGIVAGRRRTVEDEWERRRGRWR
ncbi:CynX/NimT family MFS transporter [Microbacterium pseudoresistens]